MRAVQKGRQATTRTPDLTTRFWEVPLPSLVVHRCAGQPMLLAAWVNIAAAEREDLALGNPPRQRNVLAASMGLDEAGFQRLVEILLAAEFLTSDPDGTLRVPWTPLYFASLAYAHHMQQQTATSTPAPNTAPVQQQPLALD